MQRTEMNKGVQILLERMQSNPEEFIPDWRGHYPPKWKRKIEAIAERAMHIQATKKVPEYHPPLPFLKDQEILELWQAMQNLLANQFTEEVMATLLHDATESDYPQELSSFSGHATGGTQKPAGRITLSSSQVQAMQHLDPYEKKHLLELMEEYERIHNGGTITFNTKSRTVFKGKK